MRKTGFAVKLRLPAKNKMRAHSNTLAKWFWGPLSFFILKKQQISCWVQKRPFGERESPYDENIGGGSPPW
jgi:hypothetical protein